jgi:aryl-alcohol dehydrogenase-like predicted oxidoreductase
VNQRRIGSGVDVIEVGAIGLGGASWSLADVVDVAGAEATIAAALDAGVTYIDTAAAYTTADEGAHNEKLIAGTLRRLGRTDVLVGTKGGHYRTGNTWPIDGRPESIRRDCEASLAALGVDALPLYFLHWPDPEVDFATSMGTLEELRQEGKIVRTGASNVTAEQLAVAMKITPLAAIQNNFSPFNLADRDLIAECEQLGITYVVYSPLGGPNRPRPLAEQLPGATARAAELGVSIQRLVLAWELSLSSAVLPVAGSTRPASIIDSAAASDLTLDDETLAVLERDLGNIAL